MSLSSRQKKKTLLLPSQKFHGNNKTLSNLLHQTKQLKIIPSSQQPSTTNDGNEFFLADNETNEVIQFHSTATTQKW
jgi:hypothetical protein